MTVLTCAACGCRLSPPLRLRTQLPARIGHDGRTNADGSRHAPTTVARGRYAVDPEPSGAPFVPHPDPERRGEAVCTVVPAPDGPGCPMSAGPCGTLAVHTAEAKGLLTPGCGAEMETPAAERTGPYETPFLPDAVRAVPA